MQIFNIVIIYTYLGITREKGTKLIKVRIDSLSPSLLSFLMIPHSSKCSLLLRGYISNFRHFQRVIIVRRATKTLLHHGTIKEGSVVCTCSKELKEFRVFHPNLLLQHSGGVKKKCEGV